MKVRNFAACIAVFVFIAGISASSFAAEKESSEKASPQEVIKKVREAAAFLSEAGDAGIPEFQDKNGRWVWKDTYMFVLHCAIEGGAAHPMQPGLLGRKLMGLRDPKGRLFFAEFCTVVKKPNGGWVEYWWPKVGEKTPSRKITYCLQVKDSPYAISCGIYNEEISLEELEAMLK